MTERNLTSDPPTASQIAAATADIDAAIDQAFQAVPMSQAKSLIGLAGSVTTVAALALGLPEYESEKIHGSRITAAAVHRITEELLHMTRADRAILGPMHEGRIDVIAGGALVLDRIMQRTEIAEVLVSERDILDGIARALAS
jgi:exopolyphosphatase/guanosine-5'-triphosphate,3'-diphosphate pyrophosphatase